MGWSLLLSLGEAGAGACRSLSSPGGLGWQLSLFPWKLLGIGGCHQSSLDYNKEKESEIIIKSVLISDGMLASICCGWGWPPSQSSLGEAGAGSSHQHRRHQENLGPGGPLLLLLSSGKTRAEKKIERKKGTPASAGVLALIWCGWASWLSGNAGDKSSVAGWCALSTPSGHCSQRGSFHPQAAEPVEYLPCLESSP